jgi:hypothetical protein
VKWVKDNPKMNGNIEKTEYIPFMGDVGVLIVVTRTPNDLLHHYLVQTVYRKYGGKAIGVIPVCKTRSLEKTRRVIKNMKNIVAKLPRHGDVIVMKRKHYDHFAIYDGYNSEFIEYTRGGECHATPLAFILKRELNRVMYRRAYEEFFLPDEVVRRARSQIGNKEYHIYLKNCEHFVVWAKTGACTSEVVDRVTSRAQDHFLGIARYGFFAASCSTILKLSGLGSIVHSWLAGICCVFAAPLFPWFFGVGTVAVGISSFGYALSKWIQFNVRRNSLTFHLNWVKPPSVE